MGKTEVTQGQWRAVMGSNPSKFKGDNRPVERVSWDDIQVFLKKLNAKLNLSGRYAYRLPSEAEWEYAARAGTTSNYSWGNNIDCSKANYRGESSSSCYHKPNGSYKGTKRVGSYAPNLFGLYDMHGNVWEWVEDCWNDNYRNAPNDGRAWTSGNCQRRVLRGGSWVNNPSLLRSAIRIRSNTGNRVNNFGFRLSRTAPP